MTTLRIMSVDAEGKLILYGDALDRIRSLYRNAIPHDKLEISLIKLDFTETGKIRRSKGRIQYELKHIDPGEYHLVEVRVEI